MAIGKENRYHYSIRSQLHGRNFVRSIDKRLWINTHLYAVLRWCPPLSRRENGWGFCFPRRLHGVWIAVVHLGIIFRQMSVFVKRFDSQTCGRTWLFLYEHYDADFPYEWKRIRCTLISILRKYSRRVLVRFIYFHFFFYSRCCFCLFPLMRSGIFYRFPDEWLLQMQILRKISLAPYILLVTYILFT